MAMKKKTTRGKKSGDEKSKTLRQTAARRKKPSSKRSRLKEIVRRSPRITSFDAEIPSTQRDLGVQSDAQSADTQGLSNVEEADATQTPTPATRVSRGPVDAPGKRHRRPPPQEPINKWMGEPRGKQMGQKSVKGGQRRGRG
jgi:hypothetical protein